MEPDSRLFCSLGQRQSQTLNYFFLHSILWYFAQQENQEEEQQNQGDIRVKVLNTVTGEVLSGDDAPTMTQIDAWLEMNPGYEVVPRGDGEESSSSEEEEEVGIEEMIDPQCNVA